MKENNGTGVCVSAAGGGCVDNISPIEFKAEISGLVGTRLVY